MKGLLATSRVMSKSNKTIEPWLLQFPHGLLLQFHQKLFESLPLKVPHDLKSQKRSWQISSEKLPFGWVCLPGSKKKWRSTFITRSCTMPTLCMRGIAILALPNTVKNAIYALLVQFHSKIKETKKHQSKSWNLCWLCFGLCSLFTFPYTMQFLSSLLLTLDTMSCCYEGETTETRRVKMFDNTFRRCLILIPWILLLEICWHGSDLDRLDLGCSVACLLCCLALSWPKFQDIPSICRKWTFNPLEKVLQNCLQGVPLHNFLSTETFLSATWCGTFACSTKQGPNELKNRRTKVTDILHVVHFLLQKYATMNCKFWSVSGVQNVLYAILCSVGHSLTSAFGFGKLAGRSKKNSTSRGDGPLEFALSPKH